MRPFSKVEIRIVVCYTHPHIRITPYELILFKIYHETNKYQQIFITTKILVCMLWNNLSYTSIICIQRTSTYFKIFRKLVYRIYFIFNRLSNNANCFHIRSNPTWISILKSHRQLDCIVPSIRIDHYFLALQPINDRTFNLIFS